MSIIHKIKMMKRYCLLCIPIFLIIALAGAQNYVPVWQDSRMKVKPVAAIKAYAFDLSDVHLLDGPFTEARQASVNYLLKIEPDRLLSDFRSHSGLKPKGEKYGGWESSGLAGHTMGHYLSGLAMHYAATKDEAFLKRINYVVDELDECQQARKTGYIGAIPNEDSLWLNVSKGVIRSCGFDLNGAWSPWYTFHKLMAGLEDVYLNTGNEKALKINNRLADWVGDITKDLNDSTFQKMLITEYGGMSDALVNTYALTGDKKYLDLSYRFYDKRILDSLAAQIDILPGKHSNTQIPKIIGSARRYQLTGDKRDKSIADFFWNTVTKHHSYATGGNSNYEYLGTPDQLNEKLSDNTTETCNTYNMLKLTSELFVLDPTAALMDYYEKALYNHILASQNHKTGMVTYFVSLRMGGKKEYSDEFNSFTCCVGTGMENHVKYGENIYYRSSDGGLYVNLFIPSELNWREKDIVLKQETSLPANNQSVFTIAAKKTTAFALHIRKPQWTSNPVISINGVKQKIVVDKEGYMILDRSWKNNDKIELTLPMQFYTQSMPDNINRKAIFYGPVLLAGLLGDKEPDPMDVPVFVTAKKDVNDWVKMNDNHTLTFTSQAAVPAKVSLIPFNKTADEHYTVYWDVFTPEQWTVQKKKYEEDKKKMQELDARTVDLLRTGEMQPERDHELAGEKITTGDEHNRKWRMAEDSGYFSFTMKTDPSATNTLICTYWGMDNRGRTFDIYINDTKIATEDLNKYKLSRFYDIPYTIPVELTKYKLSVKVKFVPKERNSAGPVYGIKMVKGDVSALITPAK